MTLLPFNMTLNVRVEVRILNKSVIDFSFVWLRLGGSSVTKREFLLRLTSWQELASGEIITILLILVNQCVKHDLVLVSRQLFMKM